MVFQSLDKSSIRLILITSTLLFLLFIIWQLTLKLLVWLVSLQSKYNIKMVLLVPDLIVFTITYGQISNRL